MGKLGDVPREPPKQPEIGASEDWERIEEALGYKGADPERRERLCRDLLLISDLYFGVGGRPPASCGMPPFDVEDPLKRGRADQAARAQSRERYLFPARVGFARLVAFGTITPVSTH